jgi:single-strand DNA-binding protein
MANGMNKAILIGNLGRDPELSFTKSNQAVLKFSLATTESFQNKAGERQERTEWHRIIVWGKRGEALSKFLAKGSQICVEGRIQTREYQDKDNNRRWTTEIVANEIYLLGRGRGGGAPGEPSAPNEDDVGGGGGGAGPSGGFEGGDDDIPF